jgi:hypothetical protein
MPSTTAAPLSQALVEVVSPDWTEYLQGLEPTGRYPLGLEAVGQHIAATQLFPGITNATQQPRYYSAIAWMIWTFDQLVVPRVALSKLPTAQRLWIGRMEHALRACTLYVTPALSRVIGMRKAIRLANYSPGALVPLRGKAATAFAPEAYGAGLAYLGITYRSEGRIRLTRHGVRLARAFDASIRGDLTRGESLALSDLLSGRMEIALETLLTIAERFRIRPIEPGEPEHRPLVEAFFRFDEEWRQDEPLARVLDSARARTLGLMLDLAQRGEGAIGNLEEMMPVFATSHFKDGRSARPTILPFAGRFSIWERYFERQQQKMVVSVFWHEVLNALERAHPNPVPASALVGHCQTLAAESPTLRRWIGESPLDKSVIHAMEAIANRLPNADGRIADRAFQLTQTVMTGGTAESERVGSALVLLGVVAEQWSRRERGMDVFQKGLHAHGGPQRLTLPWMMAELTKRADQTVGDLVQWLVESCVLSQALRVAYDKLVAGQERFFIQRVDGGYTLAQDRQNFLGYFSYDANRLWGAMEVLKNLDLIRWTPSLTLTRAGNDVRLKAASLL